MIKKIISFILRHKIISIAIFIIILAAAVYLIFFSSKSVKTEYVLTAVEKGTVVASVSGTGQVSASDQADIKAKISGDIVSISSKVGQEVKKGAILAQLDTASSQRALRDAQANLESAKLSLAKAIAPADDLSILQAENSLAQAQESKQSAQDNLDKAYADRYSVISNVFLDLPTIMAGLDSIFYNNTIDQAQKNIDWYANQASPWDYVKTIKYRDDVTNSYNLARLKYAKNFDDYKNTSRSSDNATVESLLSQTYETTKLVSDAIKSSSNFIDYVKDAMEQHDIMIPSAIDSHQGLLNSYTGQANSHLSSILSSISTVSNSKQSIIDAQRSMDEKTKSLADLRNPPDELTVKTQEISVTQKQNALLDAQENLANCYIRAPFDGVVAKINVKTGDSVSSGAAIASVITKQRIAEISFNEVDAAKIKAGQKVNLTFDAVDGLAISGEVLEIDTLGTVAQGVVSYTAKIGFDVQDDRVKPGMSVSAAIITDSKQDVLYVPGSAVKSKGNAYYVELPNGNGVRQQTVEIGLSNDSVIEIISGLNEGDIIVERAVSASSSTVSSSRTSTQNRSIFQSIGNPGR
jgi:RND family efflux transporter MFP subunit